MSAYSAIHYSVPGLHCVRTSLPTIGGPVGDSCRLRWFRYLQLNLVHLPVGGGHSGESSSVGDTPEDPHSRTRRRSTTVVPSKLSPVTPCLPSPSSLQDRSLVSGRITLSLWCTGCIRSDIPVLPPPSSIFTGALYPSGPLSSPSSPREPRTHPRPWNPHRPLGSDGGRFVPLDSTLSVLTY